MKKTFYTLAALIITGDKVLENAPKRPYLIPGFKGTENRIDFSLKIAFNTVDAITKEEKRNDSMYETIDYNIISIWLLESEVKIGTGQDFENPVVIRGSKFTSSGGYTGELEVKMTLTMVMKNGTVLISAEDTSGKKAIFPFNKPYRAEFPKLDSAELSKRYALSWCSDLRKAILTHMVSYEKDIAENGNN